MTHTRILVVEDENIVALDLRTMLSRLGYAVLAVVASGEGAIRKAAETCPDLVLMDVRLKGEIDGIEAAREISARLDIPIVYVTALADGDTMQRAQATASYGCIVKPFDEGELQAIIEAALSWHKAEQGAKL